MTKNNEIKQAVIFCGGKGSRLGKLPNIIQNLF